MVAPLFLSDGGQGGKQAGTLLARCYLFVGGCILVPKGVRSTLVSKER